VQISINTDTRTATLTGRWIFRATEPTTVTRADGAAWDAGAYTLALGIGDAQYAADTVTLVEPTAAPAFALDLDTPQLVALFTATPRSEHTVRLAFAGPSGTRYVACNTIIHDDGYDATATPTPA